MKRSTVAVAVLIVVSLLAVAAIGYRPGRQSPRRIDPQPTAASPESAAQALRAKAGSPVSRAVPAVLPAELDELDGHDFVTAMPELVRRARGGDAGATRLLVSRLQECLSYQAETDEAITQRVDAEYRHQRELQEKYPPSGDLARYAWTEETHRSLLKGGFDRRDRCTSLTARQIGSRLEWADLALRRHDRQAVIDFARFGGLVFSGPERVRYADRLGDLATLERTELDRLAGAGDVNALLAGASAYSMQNESLLSVDPMRAYVYGYAWSLAQNSEAKGGLDPTMAGLAGRLSPQEVEEARSRGQALHDRCCGNAGGGHSPQGLLRGRLPVNWLQLGAFDSIGTDSCPPRP